MMLVMKIKKQLSRRRIWNQQTLTHMGTAQLHGVPLTQGPDGPNPVVHESLVLQ